MVLQLHGLKIYRRMKLVKESNHTDLLADLAYVPPQSFLPSNTAVAHFEPCRSRLEESSVPSLPCSLSSGKRDASVETSSGGKNKDDRMSPAPKWRRRVREAKMVSFQVSLSKPNNKRLAYEESQLYIIPKTKKGKYGGGTGLTNRN